MKEKNPNLKVLLSVGGGSDGMAELFSGIAGDPAKRGAFIGSAYYFISTYNFDGLDIDWEYPYESDRVSRYFSNNKNLHNVLLILHRNEINMT